MKFKDIINEEMDTTRKEILSKTLEIKKIRESNKKLPYNDLQARKNNEKRISELEDDIFDLRIKDNLEKKRLKTEVK